MIPVRLKMRNFMCYRSEQELEFEAVHLACLSGENGAGKSALLAGMTWALWAKARDDVSDDDQVMSAGAADMEVQFEFILGDEHYLVVRKRSRKGTKTVPTLELQMRANNGSDDDWRPLTEHSVTATQERINKLLKMDYDTFTNSAFILQGKADSFTMKSATGRKEVLTKILGLDRYDKLADLAREEMNRHKDRIRDLESEIKMLEGTVFMRPAFVEQLAGVEHDLQEKQQELTRMQGDLQKLRRDYQDLEHANKRIVDLRKAISNNDGKKSTAQVRIGQAQAKQHDLESLLARRGEIETGVSRLKKARADEEALNNSLHDLSELETQLAKAETQVTLALGRLETEATNYERDIRDGERKLAGRSEIERQLSETMVKLRDLEHLNIEHEDAKCTRETLDVRIRTLTQEKESCEREGKNLRQKLDVLMGAHADSKGHAGCPLCATPLSAEALERVRKSFDTDIAAKRQEFERTRSDLETANKEYLAVSARIDKERELLKHLPVQQERKAGYQQKLAQLDEEAIRLNDIRVRLAAVRKTISTEDYAHEQRAAVATLRNRVARLADVRAAYTASVVARRELEQGNWEAQYHALQGAGEQLATIIESIEENTRNIEALDSESAVYREEVAELQPKITQLEDVRLQVEEGQRREDTLSNQVNEMRHTRSQLQSKIEHCDNLQRQMDGANSQLQVAKQERGIYDELVTAFGKKGIQAMIIENVLPELEDRANELLSRMTDGRMNVEFRTQRDAKSGKNVIETLDINISDEMGTRPYEMYSGGEAYRVNFAVRIALSKLLATRAGTQLQMLVIDEGFGTQDGQGREKLIGAIRSIQEDFEKILVVTHIDEIRNEFPVRIDVEKRDSGSVVTVH